MNDHRSSQNIQKTYNSAAWVEGANFRWLEICIQFWSVCVGMQQKGGQPKSATTQYFVLNKKGKNGETLTCPFMTLFDEYQKTNSENEKEDKLV